MYSIFLLLLILNAQTDRCTGLLWLYRKSDYALCNRNFKQKYPEDKNNYNATVGFFNSSYIYLCPPEEGNKSVVYRIIVDDEDKDEPGDRPGAVHVEFAPPKRECMYGVALLFNPSIQDVDECFDYEFNDTYDDWEVHTYDRDLCVFKHDNPLVENVYNATDYLYEDKIGLWFTHIFKGCYAVRFRINHKKKYVMSNAAFLNTTYKRTEVKEPQVICRYNERPNLEKSQMTNFTLDITLPPDTGRIIQVALISQQNKDRSKGCVWRGEGFLFAWIIELGVNSVVKELSDQHCDVKFVEAVKGRYEKRVQCNFQVEAPAASSCFLYNLFDKRCSSGTLWKPPSGHEVESCLWVKHCKQTYEHWRHVEILTPKTLMQSDTVLSASSYLLFPIIAIVLIISAVIGILCFRRYLRIRKEEINLYVNPQHDSNCLKSTDPCIIDNSEKEIGHGNPSCDNIVLLYTNSSPSFMALMKDFRKTLAKMCSCPVHDWHDGAVWNEVAKVGAVSWFTELLNNGCRVVWVDTPATRSAVISNLRDDESSSDKLSKYYEIHDFRDMAFRGVLEVAKNKVNINDIAQQYRRHFIVRFEGLESTANVDDPFLDLSPHARYYMPQHLMHLCSDLSVTKPKISKSKMKIDEDVYRVFVYQLYKSQTQQRLKSMKMGLDDMK